MLPSISALSRRSTIFARLLVALILSSFLNPTISSAAADAATPETALTQSPATTTAIAATSAVGRHGALRVEGNQILDQHGEVASLAGVSFFWSNNGWGGERFYRPDVVSYLQREWNVSVIRAAMGVEDSGGYIGSPANNLARVRTLVDAAIEEGIYVIVDWHSHHAEDYEAEAIEFFREIATLYGDTVNLIYEPYNEPLNNATWAGDVKPYAEAVIAAIREIDPDNLILVGSPTWSQDIHRAADDPILGYANIAYTFHFYAGTHRQWLRDRVDYALSKGIAVFCTEWGTVNANGDGGVAEAESDLWIDFMRDRQISHCNWALNNKNEGASVFLPATNPTAGDFTDADLTASGRYVKAVVQSWTDFPYAGKAELGAFTNWLSAHGLPSDLDPATDADGDGLSLATEFAFRRSPLRRETTPLFDYTATPEEMRIAVTRPRTDHSYRAEKSTDLMEWTEFNPPPFPGIFTYTATDADPGDGTFYRILATPIE